MRRNQIDSLRIYGTKPQEHTHASMETSVVCNGNQAKTNSPEESWKNLIKLNDLVGDNIAHYNLPAAQQRAIENYLNVHSYPSYRLFDKKGNLVDVKVDAWQLDNLEKIIKELNR